MVENAKIQISQMRHFRSFSNNVATCHLTKHENWTEKLRVAGASKYKMQLSFQVTARPFATFAYFKKSFFVRKNSENRNASSS